jgi:CubicO group peptidase (beta-lactamase class C family)
VSRLELHEGAVSRHGRKKGFTRTALFQWACWGHADTARPTMYARARPSTRQSHTSDHAPADALVLTSAHTRTRMLSKVPFTQDTIVRIASNTKLFTTLAAYRLRDQGKLSLDDAVTKYIPNFRVKSPCVHIHLSSSPLQSELLGTTL